MYKLNVGKLYYSLNVGKIHFRVYRYIISSTTGDKCAKHITSTPQDYPERIFVQFYSEMPQ